MNMDKEKMLEAAIEVKRTLANLDLGPLEEIEVLAACTAAAADTVAACYIVREKPFDEVITDFLKGLAGKE